MPAPVVIIGIGNRMRGDDGVGHVALDRLAETDVPSSVDLIALDGEATRLIDAWRGRRRAVVIDATRTGAEPGSVHRLLVGQDRLPGWGAGPSSHAAGLAEAIELGRMLDSLPDELIVLGVEPADVSLGEGLSPSVEAAIPRVIDQLVAEVGE